MSLEEDKIKEYKYLVEKDPYCDDISFIHSIQSKIENRVKRKKEIFFKKKRLSNFSYQN